MSRVVAPNAEPAAATEGHAVRYALTDERLLLARYATRPDPALEAELTKRFMPLALSLAGRYRGRAENDEDLRQVASLGLIKALRRYDPKVGKSFVAYAAPTILGELRRHFRDHSWRLRIPRSIQENSMLVERVTAELAEEHGATPTAAQVAGRAGITEEEVAEVLAVQETQRSVSLDAPLHSEQLGSESLGDSLGGEDLGFDRVEAQLAVESCASLDPKERQIIRLRFMEDLNQHEIGDRLNISQMQVSRVLRRGLAKMLEATQGDERPSGRRSFEQTQPDARFPAGRARTRSPRQTASA